MNDALQCEAGYVTFVMLLAQNHSDAFEFIKVKYRILLISL